MKFAVIAIVFAALGSVVLLYLRRRGLSKRSATGIALLLLSIYTIWLIKEFIPSPLTSAPVPFYKLFDISEFGYKSVLVDLLKYALPSLPLGLLMACFFAETGMLLSFICGTAAAFFIKLPELFTGPFIADEYVFAGIGCATGAALYRAALYALRKTSVPCKLGAELPSKRRLRSAFIVLAAVYFGIAFVLIADYGETYSQLQLFSNTVPLPEELVLNCELNNKESRAAIYTSAGELTDEQMHSLAAALGINTGLIKTENGYMAVDQSRNLTIYSDGTWEYSDTSTGSEDIPDADEAIRIAIDFINRASGAKVKVAAASDTMILTGESLLKPFEEYEGITRELYAQMLEEAKKPVAVDVYLVSSVDGFMISGSNEVTVSVGPGGIITSAKIFDPDLKVQAKRKIISQSEAYEMLVSGEGAYTLFEQARSARINACELIYMLNSAQGYHLPVWCFKATVQLSDGTEQEFEAYVPALK